MNLSNPDVDVTFTNEGWAATWPAAGLSLRAAFAAGDWSHEAGTSFERAGRWARTAAPEGALAVHVPDDGPVLTIEFEAAGLPTAGPVGPLRPLGGAIDLDPRTCTRLVNGYQSWDYAGVRPADETGWSWWGGAVCEPASGRGFVVHAAGASRLATSVTTRPVGDALELTVECGATPELEPRPPSWGFAAPPAAALAVDVPGGRLAAEPLFVAAGSDTSSLLADVVDLVATATGARRWDGPPITGWESWYHYGFSITPDTLLANARLLRDRFAGLPGMRLVQLDDGWQRAYGDWRPATAWPDDLSAVTADLAALGCEAGLWLAPFMVWPEGPGIGRRPDLLIGRADGTGPRTDPLMQRHGVDASHPEALEWLAELGATVRGWGFSMVKLDFLYIGALEGRRHDPSVTGTAALRRGLEAFLHGLGEGIYVLGCGMPFLPAAGVCHGNRSGGDLAAPLVWPFEGMEPFPPDQGWLGVPPQARNTAARAVFHRRLFDIDPDVVMAAGPDEGPPFALEEARTLATLAAICGGPYFLADDLAALGPGKRGVLEAPWLAALAWGPGFRPDDLLTRPDELPLASLHYYRAPTAMPDRWVGEGDGATHVVLFNWGDEPTDRVVDLGGGRAVEQWTGEVVEGPQARLTLPARAARVLRFG